MNTGQFFKRRERGGGGEERSKGGEAGRSAGCCQQPDSRQARRRLLLLLLLPGSQLIPPFSLAFGFVFTKCPSIHLPPGQPLPSLLFSEFVLVPTPVKTLLRQPKSANCHD